VWNAATTREVVRTPGSGGALDEVELEFSPPLFWCASLQKNLMFPGYKAALHFLLLWVTYFC